MNQIFSPPVCRNVKHFRREEMPDDVVVHLDEYINAIEECNDPIVWDWTPQFQSYADPALKGDNALVASLLFQDAISSHHAPVAMWLLENGAAHNDEVMID